MSEKITGYVLLVSGIIIMLYATTQIIGVFTGNAKPIKMFSIKSTPTSPSATGSTSNTDLNALLQQLKASQGQAPTGTSSLPSLPMPQLIDPEVLNNILNLTVYYVVMQFLLALGYKLSSLGVQMLRPIVVKMGEKRMESAIEEETQKVNNIN